MFAAIVEFETGKLVSEMIEFPVYISAGEVTPRARESGMWALLCTDNVNQPALAVYMAPKVGQDFFRERISAKSRYLLGLGDTLAGDLKKDEPVIANVERSER